MLLKDEAQREYERLAEYGYQPGDGWEKYYKAKIAMKENYLVVLEKYGRFVLRLRPHQIEEKRHDTIREIECLEGELSDYQSRLHLQVLEQHARQIAAEEEEDRRAAFFSMPRIVPLGTGIRGEQLSIF